MSTQILKKAIALHQQGKTGEAESLYMQVLKADPDNPDAFHLLGLIENQRGNKNRAKDLISKAISLNPNMSIFYFNLANIFESKDEVKPALENFKKATALDPNNAEAFFRIGNIYRKQNDFNLAIKYYLFAIKIEPQYTQAFNNLGAAYKTRGQFKDAVEAFRKAADLRPNSPESKNNLGMALANNGEIESAITCYKEALKLNSSFIPSLVNLGKELMLQGQVQEAEEFFEQTLEYNPKHASAHSNLLICKNYNPKIMPGELYSEHLIWAHRHTGYQAENPTISTVGPHRRLRIGYVSPDFYRHPISNFIKSILQHHNHVSYEIVCYSDVLVEDKVTESLKKYADKWQNTSGLTDDKLAALIREDGIHILIDLTGHLAGNRLQVFAQKPAPIQISYLGYPNTTGLIEMDYYLTDSFLDPDGSEEIYTESLMRLPGCFCCYSTLVDTPVIGPLPAQNSDYITFGSTHNLARLNDDLLTVWADLLTQVTNSRLIIFRTNLTDSTANRLRNFFNDKNLNSNRIECMSSTPDGYLSIYNKIDIALDTFPWSGHTTACEALWMGVPVISLKGDRHAGRMVADILSTIDLPDCIANTKKEYVANAVRLSQNIENLAKIRKTLRNRMASSTLCDGKNFTAGFEKTLQIIWREYSHNK